MIFYQLIFQIQMKPQTILIFSLVCMLQITSQYQFTKLSQQTLMLQSGVNIIQIETEGTLCYCLVASDTYFRITVFDANNKYNLISETANITAYVQVAVTHTTNPKFYLANQFIVMIYKTASDKSLGGWKGVMKKTSFGSIDVVALTNYFIGTYFQSADIFYYKDESSEEGIFHNFSQPISTKEYKVGGQTSSMMEFYRVVKTSFESYVLSFDTTDTKFILVVSQISIINGVFQSLTRSLYTASGTIVAICEYSQTTFYLQLFSGNLEIVTTQAMGVQSIVYVGVSSCEAMYYDSTTNTLAYVMPMGSSRLMYFYQISINAVSTLNLNYTNTVFVSKFTIYFANKDTFTAFTTQSCAVTYNSTTLNCLNCPTQCATCSSAVVCLSCSSGYTLMDSYCCQSFQWTQTTSVNSILQKKCQVCPTNCLTCSGSLTCLTCASGYSLMDSYCCQSFQWTQTTSVNSILQKKCQVCPTNCLTCLGSLTCLTCASGYSLMDSYCCQSFQWTQTTSVNSILQKKCQVCPTNCLTCSGSLTCLTCASGYSLMDSYCCLFSQFILFTAISGITLKQCTDCSSNCLTCSNSSNCLTCLTNYTLMSSYCCLPSQVVQETTVKGVLSKQCVNCSSNCFNCTNSTFCSLCESGYQLSWDNKCTSTKSLSTISDTLVSADNLMNSQVVSAINSLPSSRALLKPILTYLASFDDLFPYMFHQRNYGSQMESLFSTIMTMENDRWSGLDKMVMDKFASVKTEKETIIQSINIYQNYSSPTYVEREGYGQSFLISTFSFLTTNFISSFLIFAVCRGLFKLLFNHRVSLVFRSYSFWAYLVFFILEGNLQLLIFYASTTFNLTFFFRPSEKLSLVLVYYSFFFLMLFAICGYIFAFKSFKKLSKYFTDNARPSGKMVVYFTFELGIKNLLLAMVHSLFRAAALYRVQLGCLALIEIISMANQVWFLSRKGFISKIKVWILFVLSFARLLLICSLYVQQSYLGVEGVSSAVEGVILSVISFYLYTVMFELLFNILYILAEAISFLVQKIKGIQQETAVQDLKTSKKRSSKSQNQISNIFQNQVQLKESTLKQRTKENVIESENVENKPLQKQCHIISISDKRSHQNNLKTNKWISKIERNNKNKVKPNQ